jgi:hypothetical protein
MTNDDFLSSDESEVRAMRWGPPVEFDRHEEELQGGYERVIDLVNDELAHEVWKWREKVYGKSGERSPGKGGRIPGGMVGYEERKAGELFEAAADRKEARALPEKERLEKIEQVAKMYPQVRIKAIAERVVPWDYDVFKRLAALAIAEYKKSLLS